MTKLEPTRRAVLAMIADESATVPELIRGWQGGPLPHIHDHVLALVDAWYVEVEGRRGGEYVYAVTLQGRAELA